MTNVEFMDYTHFSHPSTFASLSKYRALFAGIIRPPYTFLKTATIPTYYGIFIAILRYTAIQLSTIPFIMTCSIIVILLCMIMWLTSYLLQATIHNSFIHVTLDSLQIPVHRWRHSYRVIFCSKYRVVILEL